jgi:large subunit ribosomal protein L35
MAKGSRSKTRKSVAKRFRISAGGKVKMNKPGRRHLAGSKNRKRKRTLAIPGQLKPMDARRVKDSLPFS